jgi:hypothetical protein
MNASSRATQKRPLSILCLVAVVLLGAFGTIDAQSRTSAGASDHLIVPGQRIGPIFIGMTETQLYQRLGNPSETTRGKDGTWIEYDYNNLGLTIYADPATHKVYMIETGREDSPYSTREGIRVGSSELQIQILPWKLLWKRPGPARLWKFQYPGIQIETQNGNVIFIAVQSHN